MEGLYGLLYPQGGASIPIIIVRHSSRQAWGLEEQGESELETTWVFKLSKLTPVIYFFQEAHTS